MHRGCLWPNGLMNISELFVALVRLPTLPDLLRKLSLINNDNIVFCKMLNVSEPNLRCQAELM